MRRTMLLAGLLACLSPFIAGLLAWGFVDVTLRTGLLYRWFFGLNIEALQSIKTPGLEPFTVGVAIYFVQYLALLSVVRWLIRWLSQSGRQAG